MVKNIYHWSLDERFTPDQMHQIQAAGLDLEVFINDITGGRGRDVDHCQDTRNPCSPRGSANQGCCLFTGLPTSLVFPYTTSG